MIKLQWTATKMKCFWGFTPKGQYFMPLLYQQKGLINWWMFIRYGSLKFRLGIRCGPLSKHPLPPARHLPHLMIVSIHPSFPGISPDQEMRQSFSKSYRAALITSENPELREVGLEPSSKRGCSNKKKVQNNLWEKATHQQIVSHCFGNIHNPELREVDLEPSS